MTITVNTVKSKPKMRKQRKRQWSQNIGPSAKQLEMALRRDVIKSFKELDYYVSNGGQRYDESVTFSTHGWGIKDLVFKNEGGLTKWQNAKKWLCDANAWLS